MRLIERGSQLAALHQYADEASHAQGRLVLVSGEAGIGKSALLEDFAQQSADARWLWAGCDGLFTPAALGPLLDIAAQLGVSCSGFARLTRNGTSYMAHCCVNSTA